MLPKNHIILSGVVVGIISLFYTSNIITILSWTSIAIFITVFMDLDHLIYISFKKDKRKYVYNSILNPIKTLMDTKEFAEKTHFKGVGIIRSVFHIFTIFIIAFLSYKYIPSLYLPIIISLMLHWISDIIQILIDPSKR